LRFDARENAGRAAESGEWRGVSGEKRGPDSTRRCAVLPLANLSNDPNQEYFSDAMTDALITDLAQIGSLKVISRTSIMRYKRTDKSLPEIARELNVDGIVEGTVQRSGDPCASPCNSSTVLRTNTSGRAVTNAMCEMFLCYSKT